MSLNSLVLVDCDAQTPSRVMQNQGGETLDNRYDHLCKILLIDSEQLLRVSTEAEMP